MNWKRGLTRIYVVLWLVVAAGGLFIITLPDIQSNNSNVAIVREYVTKFPLLAPGDLSVDSWATEDVDAHAISIEDRAIPTDTTQWIIPEGAIRVPREDTKAAVWAAKRVSSFNTTRYAFKQVGWWLLLFGAMPAVFLLTVRWISAGFAKN